MVAKLDNCNNNKSRHRWSKQNVHRSSFPRKVGTPLKFGPAELLSKSGGYALPIPHDVLMTLSYCKSAAIREIGGNPHIYAFFWVRKDQMCRKPVAWR